MMYVIKLVNWIMNVHQDYVKVVEKHVSWILISHAAQLIQLDYWMYVLLILIVVVKIVLVL